MAARATRLTTRAVAFASRLLSRFVGDEGRTLFSSFHDRFLSGSFGGFNSLLNRGFGGIRRRCLLRNGLLRSGGGRSHFDFHLGFLSHLRGWRGVFLSRGGTNGENRESQRRCKQNGLHTSDSETAEEPSSPYELGRALRRASLPLRFNGAFRSVKTYFTGTHHLA